MRYYIEYIKMYWIRYVICVLLIVCLCLSFAHEEITLTLFEADITIRATTYYLYNETFQGVGFFVPLLYLISGLPATASFFDEYQAGSVNYQMIRLGNEGYLDKKSILCFSSAMLTLMAGLMLYTGYLHFLVVSQGNEVILEGQATFLGEHPYLLLVIRNLLLAGNAAMWNMIALVVSCFWGNRYLILTIPVALYFIWERMALFLSDYVDVFSLTLGYEKEMLQYPFNLIYAFAFFLTISTVCGIVFVIQGRKCVQRERIT